MTTWLNPLSTHNWLPLRLVISSAFHSSGQERSADTGAAQRGSVDLVLHSGVALLGLSERWSQPTATQYNRPLSDT